MIAQQRLRLIQQLSFVFGAGTLITPPQLLQDLFPCRRTYHFIHSATVTVTFGATYPFPRLYTPSRVTKLLAQFAAPRKATKANSVLAIRLRPAIFSSSLPSDRGPLQTQDRLILCQQQTTYGRAWRFFTT